jgi:hypothetical protein
MKVLNLRCALDHRFEGWFGSDEDYRSQSDAGLIECPVCADKAISRLPAAPRLNLGAVERPAPTATVDSSAPLEVTLQAAWLRAMQHVISRTDDVGDRFPEEARRIHYGEIDERAIRGRATPDEAQALKDEGIEVLPLPVPAAFKDTLQ